MHHSLRPALILYSLMHTLRMRVLRVRPVDWITFTEHADYIVRSSGVYSQVIPVLSVREGNREVGTDGQTDFDRFDRKRLDTQSISETTQLSD